MTKITTTDVKQNTKKIFDMAKKKPLKIFRYGEAEFVIMDISLWEDKFMIQNNKNIKITKKDIKNPVSCFDQSKVDDVMTKENKLEYKKAIKELKNNKTVSLNDLKSKNF